MSIFAIIARALVIEFCWRRCRWLWWLQGPYAAEQSTWWREHGELGREHGELCSSAVAAARAATLVARCKGFGALWQSVVECEHAWGEGGEESGARGGRAAPADRQPHSSKVTRHRLRWRLDFAI